MYLCVGASERELRVIHRELLLEEEHGFLYLMRKFSNHRETRLCTVWVKDDMVGFILLMEDGLTPDVINIFIHHRRKGYGATVLNILEERSSRNPLHIISSPRAEGFYQKQGYRLMYPTSEYWVKPR